MGYSQESTITGVILDQNNTPVPNVSVKAGDSGTETNENGFYSLKIPSGTNTIVEFSHLAY